MIVVVNVPVLLIALTLTEFANARRRSHRDVRSRRGEVSRVTGVRRESRRGVVGEEISRTDDARQDSGRVCCRHRAVDKHLARSAECGRGDLKRGTRSQRQVAVRGHAYRPAGRRPESG